MGAVSALPTPEGGGRLFGPPPRCSVCFGKLAARRQHEPRLCSAWIPRSRTQRLTVVEVRRCGMSKYSRRRVAQNKRTTLRSRLLKQHSASERVTANRLRHLRAFFEPRERISHWHSLQLPIHKQIQHRASNIQPERRYSDVSVQARKDSQLRNRSVLPRRRVQGLAVGWSLLVVRPAAARSRSMSSRSARRGSCTRSST